MKRSRLLPGLAAAAVFAAGAHAQPVLAQTPTPAADSANRLAARADTLDRRQSSADLTAAIALWTQAATLFDRAGLPAGVGRALSRIGVDWRDLGQLDSALVYYRRALPLRHDAGDRAGEGATLHNMGVVYRDLGLADSALTYLRRAVAVRRLVRDRAGEGSTLGNLGAVYLSLGRADSALAYFRPALAIHHETGRRADEARTLGNIGIAFRELGGADSALAYYRQTLPIWRELRDPLSEATAYNNIGALFQAAGTPDSALAYYRLALATSRNAADARNEGATLHNVGTVHAELGHGDSALAAYAGALRIARAGADRWVESETLASLGDFYLHVAGAGRVDPARATAYYDSAATVYGALRGHAGSDANVVSVAERQQELFAGWTLAWLARAGEVGTMPSARAAFAAAERGRSPALLAVLRRTTSPAASAVNDAARGAAPAGADLAAEADALLAPLRARHTAALSYLLARDTLVTWLLTAAGELHVSRSAIARDTIARLVRVYRATLGVEEQGALFAARSAVASPESRRDDRASAAAADRLARLLLPATLRDAVAPAGDVVIVPQGVLALVPFGALPTPGSPATPLGIRYALRFAPSLAALGSAERHVDPRVTAAMPRAARRRAFADALVVGNPAMPPLPASLASPPLEPLPAAEREARWVATELGVPSLVGRAATESMVWDRLPNAPLVHFATHGLAFSSEAQARDSFIALAPDSASDGLLTMGEVIDAPQLSLRAELVVLSACRTGLGTLTRAEGAMGLQRAFLARGARSVLVSLWSVSDDATELLMRRLYTHWIEDVDGPSKAEALRRAQADVRRTPGLSHPRFWAAFQLVGAR